MADFHIGRPMFVRTLVLSLGVASISSAQGETQISNPAPITIHTPNTPGPDGRVVPSKAAPYPSTIHITGFWGPFESRKAAPGEWRRACRAGPGSRAEGKARLVGLPLDCDL